ncbi:Thiamine biosynthesis lipoprotein ApbE precursor [Pelotomaculum sp. FP]|uniref:FAD:protein FMN transferase n=1 Tax=Pelotomaculum sp. FP TaxID=261474 RepID=UPI001102D65D|nr:FAD:protein FMN transferase [Pelotomaculum sp. FP]TEB14652.1 Thiamine biosynthesis lipoprotein ApbE precursor [Pelotomaculum sp. FP]
MTRTVDAQSTDLGMGTVMTHRASGKYAEEALRAVGNEAVRLEELLSRFRPGSEISRINRSAGLKGEKLSADTYEILSCAIEFSRTCQGFFDVTVGHLVKLWGSFQNTSKPPEELRIKQILPLVDYTGLVLDPCEKAARLQKAGQSVDLGGIGKGFAGDKFLEVFKKYGVSSAFTNIGGNVVTLGTKPDGSPWRVGIQHPRLEDSLMGFVSVVDKAVVTSGDYQRYFIDSNGKRHHHILDPSTGYPAESGLVSVTIVADSSTVADALSTILFVAGMGKGLGLLRRFPGAEAIIVDMGLQVYVTEGLRNCFQAGEGINVMF